MPKNSHNARLSGRIPTIPEGPKISMQDIQHTRIDDHDFYYLKHPLTAPSSPLTGLIPLIPLFEIANELPFLHRLVSDVYVLCPGLWMVYLVQQLFKSLMPAFILYFSGQLFEVIQIAIEKREADRSIFIRAAIGTAVCNMISRAIDSWDVEEQIQGHIIDGFAGRSVHAQLKLDLPTSEDPVVRSMLAPRGASSPHFPWTLVSRCVSIITMIIQLSSQIIMLLRLLRDHPENMSLVLWSFAGPMLTWMEKNHIGDSYFVMMDNETQTMNYGVLAVCDPRRQFQPNHRQEIVVGNLADRLWRIYQRTKPPVEASRSSSDIWNRYRGTSLQASAARLLRDAIAEGPKIAFALNALKTPANIPLSLATLTVVQDQVAKFTQLLSGVFYDRTSLAAQLTSIKDLYELDQIPNQVRDGEEPFPSLQKKGQGVTIDFKDVSFRYPSANKDSLSHVSFHIGAGELAVIVGANGQGKSSILKLLTRLYDPTEGVIFVDGKAISEYRLADLRKATSVLFQDFTVFPFSVRENIAMGDPDASDDAANENRIQRAAELGGASEFIPKLPRGMSQMMSSFVGVDYGTGPDSEAIGRAVLEESKRNGRTFSLTESLSGGEQQRLALARTFMRDPDDLSLLIYDEPSAALDPLAEYNLFKHLISRRGSKTMVFSTHRYGHLTKHADVILFVKDSTITEAGTHEQLMALNGGYAEVYQIQAEGFAG